MQVKPEFLCNAFHLLIIIVKKLKTHWTEDDSSIKEFSYLEVYMCALILLAN